MQNNTPSNNQYIELPLESESNNLGCNGTLDEQVTACLSDGYLRIANQLMVALCQVKLSDRESRVLNVVIMKTYGFNKSFDWICNSQFKEITGISETHISAIKKRLIDRNVLIKENRKVGVNPIVSDWYLSKKCTKTPSQGNNKVTLVGVAKKLKQGSNSPKQDKEVSQIRNHKKQNNKTKNTNTRNNADAAKSFSHKISFDTLPYDISIETAEAFIEHRKLLKSPLTQRAFDLVIAEVCKAPSIGLTPEQAIDEIIAAGWKGFKIAWLENRGENTSSKIKAGFNNSGLDDTSWADNFGLKQ